MTKRVVEWLIFCAVAVSVATATFMFAWSQPVGGVRTAVRAVAALPAVLVADERPHYVYGILPQDAFDRAYARALETVSADGITERPRSVISAHHLLVLDAIAEVFSSAASDDVRTVIVLSPNHFNAGHAVAQTSEGIWETPYGDVETDARSVRHVLRALPFVQAEPVTFAREHGISALTPFIAHSFPRAEMIPLVLHDSLTSEQATQLGSTLAREFPDAVVIASIDMSHYLPQLVQQFHDDSTLRSLKSAANVPLEIDASSVLAVLRTVNRVRETETFHLTHHGSSLQMEAASSYADNTSHILGYFTSGVAEDAPFASVHMLGDIMLDRGVRRLIDRHGSAYPWEYMHRFLSGSHLVVANLEGTVGEEESIANDDTVLRFRFAPEAVRTLTSFVDLVSLANNHSMDFGGAGEKETHMWLTEVGLPWFGRWHTPEPRYDADVNGIPLTFIGYHQFKPDEETLVSQIQQANADGRFVIVMPHWGTEYQFTPDAAQLRLARVMVDAGADVIIGSHPHVVQTVDVIDGVPVVYSLGNFIFDQRLPDTWTGLTVGLTIDPSSVTLRLLPVSSKDGQPRPLEDAETTQVLSSMAARSAAAVRDEVRTGIIRIDRQ